jgi:hypothetical protein
MGIASRCWAARARASSSDPISQTSSGRPLSSGTSESTAARPGAAVGSGLPSNEVPLNEPPEGFRQQGKTGRDFDFESSQPIQGSFTLTSAKNTMWLHFEIEHNPAGLIVTLTQIPPGFTTHDSIGAGVEGSANVDFVDVPPGTYKVTLSSAHLAEGNVVGKATVYIARERGLAAEQRPEGTTALGPTTNADQARTSSRHGAPGGPSLAAGGSPCCGAFRGAS